MIKQFTTFSLLLGLVDYINPIIYMVTIIIILRDLRNNADESMYKIFSFGAIISLIGGFLIPLVKTIVGLGIIDFVLPVPVVHIVNTGFLISGVTLFLIVKNKTYKQISLFTKLIVLAIYIVGFIIISVLVKYNTAVILSGVIGILFIYFSVLYKAYKTKKIVSMILVILSLCMTIFLSFVGSKFNLNSPIVHWIIELTNIVCQLCLMLSVKLLK